MYLIAQNLDAAVDGSSNVVIIDWVNVQNYSGTFNLSWKKTHSGNSLTYFKIDESDDGVTVDDTLPGATSISAVDAGISSVTSTAKYLRVRFEGTSTTASAILLAESSDGLICTLSDIKDRLGIPSSDTDNDTAIVRIIAGIKSLFESYCQRQLILNSAAETEYYTGCGRRLQLARYPVVNISSIIESWDYGFDEDALTADTDYRLVNAGKKGIIYRMYTNWNNTEDGIQVIYKGGFCPAGVAPSTGEYAMPDDLREAAIEQASFVYKRRDDIGLSGTGFEGGSIDKFEPLKLLPQVRLILDSYRRQII